MAACHRPTYLDIDNDTLEDSNSRVYMDSKHLTSQDYETIFDSLTVSQYSYDKNKRRIPLPYELALYIMHLAGCTYDLRLSPTPGTHLYLSSNGPLIRKMWFVSPPLDEGILRRTSSMTLITTSKHRRDKTLPQQGSSFWWEVGVIREGHGGDIGNEGTIPDSSNVKPIHRFVSHYYKASQVNENTELTLTGVHFGRDHEFWTGQNHSQSPDGGSGDPIRKGDRIAVYGCAQTSGHECIGVGAQLCFAVYWRPKEV